MKERKYKNNYIETDRKTRVKMYKSGKQWVSSLISNIGLTKIFKGIADKNVVVRQEVLQKSDTDSDSLLDSKTEKLIKGAAAAGTLAGGVFVTQGIASADQVNKALELQTDQNELLANAETVTIEGTSTSETDSTSLSTSESTSASVAGSTSASLSASESTSNVVSESLSTSESATVQSSNSETTSVSTSESTSAVSESTSTSNVSESTVQSQVSESTSVSTSEVGSLSESTSETAVTGSETQVKNNEKTYEVISGLTYEVTTAADGTKNYRLTSIMPRPEWQGMTFAEAGITGSGFRSVTNGTKTTFNSDDFLKSTVYEWSGGNGKFSNTMTGLSAVYDAATKTINWTVTYDPSSVLSSANWKKNGAYMGLWIDTTQDSRLGKPTNVKVDGSSTRAVTFSEAYSKGATNAARANKNGTEYVSQNPLSMGAHKFTFTTTFNGTPADLGSLKIGLVTASATATNRTVSPYMYETGAVTMSGRYNNDPNDKSLPKKVYISAAETTTAVSGIDIGGIKESALPKVKYSISGTVYEDADRNGIRNEGEQVKSGVTVVLKNSVGTEIARTTTDTNGGYTFSNQVSGNYTVSVIPPAGYTVIGNSYFNTSGNASVTLNDSNLTNVDVGLYNSASESTSLSQSQSTAQSQSASRSLSASQSESTSRSLSTEQSQSTSRSLSTSQSQSASRSLSISQSASRSLSTEQSQSTSRSLSTSQSQSASRSLSESQSASRSLSTEQSQSTSRSLSTSQSQSASRSLSMSQSASRSLSTEQSQSTSRSLSTSQSQSA
ncbi:SdrD B-like domain-containing protein, partial [Ligilactobacillus animalis]